MESLSISKNKKISDIVHFNTFELAYYTRKNPYKESNNEDSLSYFVYDKNSIILVVADGVGGHPKGDDASEKVVSSLKKSIKNYKGSPLKENNLRNSILNGIEKANKDLIQGGIGSRTTVTVCEIQNTIARTYQVGDSELFICGQKGKLKYRTTSHSPVGYGVEAGLIDEKSALSHPDRHFISNVVGDSEMKIEMGPKIELASNDTILIGSDGLFDNFTHQQLTEWIRKGKIEEVHQQIIEECEKFVPPPPEDNEKAKYDDISFILFRLR